MPMTPREILRLLKENGFQEVSQNSSHRKLYNPTTNRTVIVPVHAKELKTGTERSILKRAGLL